MRVFISWSGPRSEMVANALRQWLTDVDRQFAPWMSSTDVAKGARWSQDLFGELESAEIGIVCLTPENVNAAWVLFEAGAIGKALDKSRVCTYLFDMSPAELEGPLVQYQATVANKEDTRKLVHDLNKALPEKERRPSEQTDRVFEKWWPDLEKSLASIKRTGHARENSRSDRQLLEELLDLTREQTHRISDKIPARSSEPLSFERLFAGEDVERLVNRLKLDQSDQDANAVDWTDGSFAGEHDTIEGQWHSRWNGGTAYGEWLSGKATLIRSNDYIAIWYDQFVPAHSAPIPYIILAHRTSGGLFQGRYINLLHLRDSTPWVGSVVHTGRIDGEWTQGRWDLRR